MHRTEKTLLSSLALFAACERKRLPKFEKMALKCGVRLICVKDDSAPKNYHPVMSKIEKLLFCYSRVLGGATPFYKELVPGTLQSLYEHFERTQEEIHQCLAAFPTLMDSGITPPFFYGSYNHRYKNEFLGFGRSFAVDFIPTLNGIHASYKGEAITGPLSDFFKEMERKQSIRVELRESPFLYTRYAKDLDGDSANTLYQSLLEQFTSHEIEARCAQALKNGHAITRRFLGIYDIFQMPGFQTSLLLDEAGAVHHFPDGNEELSMERIYELLFSHPPKKAVEEWRRECDIRVYPPVVSKSGV